MTMGVDTQIGIAPPVKSGISSTAAVLGIGLCLATVLAVFWPTTLSMVEAYQRSETYEHCFLVLPIFFWLVWGERDRLSGTPAKPYWIGALLIAACGAVWLIGVL